MTYLIVEILIFLIIAFAIGFAVAWFLRGRALEAAKAALANCEARVRSAEAPPAPVTAMAVAGQEPGRPIGLAEADGQPDDLQAISGVGPKIESLLHGLGVFHYRQIADWTPENVEWVDSYLKFKGRIGREDWIAQAQTLAAGGETDFSKGRKS